MNRILLSTACATGLLALAATTPAMAQHAHGADHGASHAQGGVAGSGQMVDGELRKVDKAAKRVTIHHGEIKNLGMPAMTMVFDVKDPALIAKAKAGDKVRFKAAMEGGAMVLTALEVVK